MEWVDRDDLSKYNLVNDFMELLQVMDQDGLTEFQYIVREDEWKVSLR